jgi:hypothetical protein
MCALLRGHLTRACPLSGETPRHGYRFIELSMEDKKIPIDRGQHKERQHLTTVFAELIEAAKHNAHRSRCYDAIQMQTFKA